MHPVSDINQNQPPSPPLQTYNEDSPLVSLSQISKIDDSAQPVLENYNWQSNCNRCSYLKVTVLAILTSPMWGGGTYLWANASSKTELIAGLVLVGLGIIIPCISAFEFLLRGKSCIFDMAPFVRCYPQPCH